MRKIALSILSTLILSILLLNTAGAINFGTYASAYISETEVWAESDRDGEVTFWGDVTCVNKMDKIGISKIVIQKKVSNSWTNVYTKFGSTTNSLLSTDKSKYVCSVPYDGVSGQIYRAVITLYAGDSTGSDTKERTTNAVVA